MVENLGLEEVVTFTGLRRDVPELLGLFDLFVLQSLWEGFGLVLAEAMAMSKAVVATDVDAIPEVVEDRVTGLLVPPRDSQTLAAQIIRLLDDPDLRARMGANGRRRVEGHFTSEIMVGKLESLYISLAREEQDAPLLR